MADIFVSYRRDDSKWSAGRINDRLIIEFGSARVFFDTVTIEPGEDFHEVLGAMVGSCKVLIAVIGPDWLPALSDRTDDTNDFVRIEIAQALKRGVRVVPVLIDGAKSPPEERLPEDLKPLARRNAITISAENFRTEADRLCSFLKTYLEDTKNDPLDQTEASSASEKTVAPQKPTRRRSAGPAATGVDIAYGFIKDSENPADWEKFVADYPDSGLIIVAKSKARQLRARRENEKLAA